MGTTTTKLSDSAVSKERILSKGKQKCQVLEKTSKSSFVLLKMSFLRRSFQQINFELRERFCEEKSERTQEGRGGERSTSVLVYNSPQVHDLVWKLEIKM
jgi:hypothetical protein